MINSFRYNFVSLEENGSDALLNDFRDFMIAIGSQELPIFADDVEIRSRVTSGEIVALVVSADDFRPWFDASVVLSGNIEISMHYQPLFSYFDHSVEVDGRGLPLRVKGNFLRETLDLCVAGSPSNSLDMSLMHPLLMAGVLGVGEPKQVGSIKDGLVDAYTLPSGWLLLMEPLLHPDHRYGVGSNG